MEPVEYRYRELLEGAFAQNARILGEKRGNIVLVALNPDGVFLSNGPGDPTDVVEVIETVRKLKGKYPIFGICLGHQAIGESFGGKLTNLSEVYHGVATPSTITVNDYIFEGLPEKIEIGRYHSWVVDTKDLPSCLEVTSVSDEGYSMSLRHKEYDIRGIQYHPESVLTPEGKTILKNWLSK